MIDTLFSALLGGNPPDYDYYEKRQNERAVKPPFAPRALADKDLTSLLVKASEVNEKARSLLNQKSFFSFSKPKQLTYVCLFTLAAVGTYHTVGATYGVAANITSLYASIIRDVYNAWTSKAP